MNGTALKVRQFSTTAIKPFDIVFNNYNENDKYSPKHITFRTEQQAQRYKNNLELKFKTDKMVQYIKNHWIYEGSL